MKKRHLLVVAVATLLFLAVHCGPEHAKPATVSGTWHGSVLQHPLSGVRDLEFEAEMILSETDGRVTGTRRIASSAKFAGSGDILEKVSGTYNPATGVLMLSGSSTYAFKPGTYEYWFETQDQFTVMRADYSQEGVGGTQKITETFRR